MAAGALFTGIGFTMSLFIAGLAYDPEMLTAAKIGILGGSTVSAAAGFLMLIRLASKRTPRMSHDWLMRFLEHRIADRRLLRLIGK